MPMFFRRNYQTPFWRGLLHAVMVMLYTIFVSLLMMSLNSLYMGGISQVIQFTFLVFVLVVSLAIYIYLIFFEPVRMVLHQHFKAGTIMIWSTLGWLFVFMCLFVLGLAFTLNTSM